MDIISNQAINPNLIGKSALELVPLSEDSMLVPIVQTSTFRNIFKIFFFSKTDLLLTL